MTYDPKSILQGLDEPCPTCSLPCGNHTLRQWAACTTEAGTHDPFRELADDEPVPAKALEVVYDGEQLIVADHLDFVAAAVELSSPIAGPLPLLVFDFRSSTPDPLKPTRVSRVGYLGSADGMRLMGKTLRHAANAAANKAELRGGRR